MKKFAAFALLALMAFAQDDTAGDEVAGDDAAGDDAAGDDAAVEEVVDTWETTFVWEDIYPGTGVVTGDKASNWSKKFKDADIDAAVAGMPTTAKVYPDEDGSQWIDISMKGGWDVKWEDKTDGNAKAHYANIGMLWIADTDLTDPEAPVVLAAEQTTSSVNKSSGTLAYTGLEQNTTDGCPAVDYSKQGLEMCETVLDVAPITAWAGSSEIVKDSTGKLLVGMTLDATRPLVPTEDRASAITLKNQTPQFFCEAVWINREDIIGYAEQHCAVLLIDIPVPDPEPVEPVVEEPTDTGANALYATAVAFAAIAAMAF